MSKFGRKIKIFTVLGPSKFLTENPKFWPVGLVFGHLRVSLNGDQEWVSDDWKRDFGDNQANLSAFWPLPQKVSKSQNF